MMREERVTEVGRGFRCTKEQVAIGRKATGHTFSYFISLFAGEVHCHIATKHNVEWAKVQQGFPQLAAFKTTQGSQFVSHAPLVGVLVQHEVFQELFRIKFLAAQAISAPAVFADGRIGYYTRPTKCVT